MVKQTIQIFCRVKPTKAKSAVSINFFFWKIAYSLHKNIKQEENSKILQTMMEYRHCVCVQPGT